MARNLLGGGRPKGTVKVQCTSPSSRQVTFSTGSERAVAMNDWSIMQTSGCCRPMRKYGQLNSRITTRSPSMLDVGVEAFFVQELTQALEPQGQGQADPARRRSVCAIACATPEKSLPTSASGMFSLSSSSRRLVSRT